MCIFYDTATISNFCIFILFSSIHTTLLAGVVHRQKNTDELVIICSRLQKKKYLMDQQLVMLMTNNK